MIVDSSSLLTDGKKLRKEAKRIFLFLGERGGRKGSPYVGWRGDTDRLLTRLQRCLGETAMAHCGFSNVPSPAGGITKHVSDPINSVISKDLWA